MAAQEGHCEVARLLLKAKAVVNIENNVSSSYSACVQVYALQSPMMLGIDCNESSNYYVGMEFMLPSIPTIHLCNMFRKRPTWLR